MLAARVKANVGDALEDINEMVILCRGFAPGTSPGYLTSSLQALTGAVLDAYSRGKQIQGLDQAIECIREALKTCPPGSHQVRVTFDLANLLAVRFLVHHVDNNYEEAKVLLDPLTAIPSPGNPPCSYRHQASALKAALGYARPIVNPNHGNIEGSIPCCRSFLDHCSLFGNPLHPVITELLAKHAEKRFQQLQPPQGAQIAHSNVAHLPSFLQLYPFGGGNESDIVKAVPSLTVVESKIKRLRPLCSSTLPGTERQRQYLDELVHCYDTKISLTHDITDIEEVIRYRRILLNSTRSGDPSRFFQLSILGNYLFMAYTHTGRLEVLNESITLHREVLGLENTQLVHFNIIQRLIRSLYTRWRLFRYKSDLDEVMKSFASGTKNTSTTIPSRFELACHWVDTARTSRHNSLPTAFEHAMSLMQSSLLFTPILPTRHTRLFEKHDLYEKTPLNFASYQIRIGQLKRATEVLEQGRALLWSEMRGFRTSTDRLREAQPDLAKEFTAINQELEILTASALSKGMGDGASRDELIGPLSGLMKRQHERQHELLMKRDALISRIGVDNFLLPLPFDTLCSAASHGPVIIINHCKWRSDIIIVLRDSPPSHIPTPYDFFDRASRLKHKLLNTRVKYGLDSGNHEDALSFVLAELYEFVGRPVIRRLNKLGIPEQSRVWWCPTSVFGYLPLHAMGPIPSDGGDLRYFSDLYISSYTPTLSALIRSREPDTRTYALPTSPVAQLGPFQPEAWADIPLIRGLDLQSTSLSLRNIPLTTVLDSLQRHQFAHLAYHSTSKTPKQIDATVLFYNRERLNLLEIVRSRHSAGGFAFLPASHMAELTDGIIPDEALHISAALQYSGYRSVIGTMWGMVNKDGRDLAKDVYRSMYSGKDRGPYYERSARALQHAVQQMRCNLPLVRWVNYVHYGA
jgi:CHAT domain